VYAFSQLGAGVNQHHVRGRRCVPQDIDFVIIRRMRCDEWTLSGERLVNMQMYGSGCRLVLQHFPGMNVVERRLQESPQDREHTESDAADSHSFSAKIPPPA
jgi:hypothetical protein